MLRIMKVLKLHQSQLAYFPSYFYKNVLFKMVEENRYASWDRAERFVTHNLTFTKAALTKEQTSIKISNKSVWLFIRPPVVSAHNLVMY